ncbi:uncharacterized protein EV420DRAFT_1074251 [Desarmillaria tabescens]|uniref:Peptidase C14 caspase domain-containing protein n=1 Tax=Armillaria tabescens TaxID=1929756 RepID=A0AA39JH64_ARMTA|nr:uncharacterized protein EV420DRAFT_1074251 [Desarmillaria tabescens]KAK0442702.1 hypothetical protein EV420DRAFT_1074251 [Desarmillaria tabescens]
MENYLVEDLDVPKHRMQLLLGATHALPDDPRIPSRDNIVHVLHSLVNNPEINHGYNIIIYFAERGTSYSYSDWEDNSYDADRCSVPFSQWESIYALCPMDRDCPDSDGDPVPDISDREFNSILTQISRSKGHRIIVILDCSHAGTATRYFPDAGVRSALPLIHALIRMLRAADESTKRFPAVPYVLSKDWVPDMSSHVVLAACREFQFAKEMKSGDGYYGLFTQLLVRTLRQEGSKQLTYVELLFAIPPFLVQTPVVAGKHDCKTLVSRLMYPLNGIFIDWRFTYQVA